MVAINIAGKEYEIKNDWREYTADEFLKLQSKVTNAPERLLKMLEHVVNGDKESLDAMDITEEEEVKIFPNYYGQFICAWAGVPEEDIKKVNSEERINIIQNNFFHFVIGCFYYPMNVPNYDRDYFEFKGDKFILPKARKFKGEDRPMGYIPTMQFTEAADLEVYMRKFDKGDHSKLKNIVSILCLKEGEEYDEDISLRRADEFGELTMDIVWDVFFYLSELVNISVSHTLISSMEKINQSKELLQQQQD